MNRFLDLEGAVNFRDIGGYQTTDNRQVRCGLVYRADGLSRLTTRDLCVLADLGIATVIDVRSNDEWEGGHFPTQKLPVALFHIPFVEKLDHPDKFDLEPGLLASQYLEIIDEAGKEIVKVLEILSQPSALPAIVHCTAGKDRTGVLVALLLSLLDVTTATVIADYALSKGAMVHLRQKLIERYPEGKKVIERINEVFSAEPENMERLLTYINVTYGSPKDYVENMGLSPESLQSLQHGLLEASQSL